MFTSPFAMLSMQQAVNCRITSITDAGKPNSIKERPRPVSERRRLRSSRPGSPLLRSGTIMFDEIIACLDGSPLAETILPLACGLAETGEKNLALLRVVEDVEELGLEEKALHAI